MEKRLTADLNVVSNSNLEIQLLDGDLNIIQKLDDEPNDVGGLTSAELKAKFDESGNIIKKYINETLIPAVLTDDATEESRKQAEAARVAAEQGRVTAEEGRVSAESGRVSAEQARANAEASRVSAESARVQAETARADETAGIVARATAQANAAVGSASQAQASAAAAAQSAASVDGINKTAQSWAVGGTGTRPGEDTDNAKYWAKQAQTAVAGSVRYDAAQSLSNAQKEQARGNIGALALVTGNINLYVSPSGNDDTGDGSSARPYRTIQHAVDAIPPVLNGHSIRINVSPGTYEEDVQIVGKACMSGYRPVEIRGASDLDGAESYQIKSLYVAGVGMGIIAIKGFKFLGNTTNGFDVYSYGDAAIRVDSCIMDAANDNGVSFNDRPFAIAQIVESTISNKKKAAVRAEHGCIALVRGCTGSNNAVAFAAGYDSGFGGCIVDCGSNSISATTSELKRYGGQIFK